MDNTEEKNTQNCTPGEAYCCDPAPEQAPVTVEMIEEAFERLRNMVNQCKTPVLLHMLIEKEGRVSGECGTCEAVVDMSGPKGTEWIAARGYLFASVTCFSGNPDVVSQGVKLAFERAPLPPCSKSLAANARSAKAETLSFINH